MPYCRKRKLLFLHIPKNGGQSIEFSLFGENLKGPASMRSPLNRIATFAARKTAPSSVLENLYGTIDYTLCAQHLTYAEIKLLDLIPAQDLKNTFIFSVVRNPYTRITSSVFHFGKYLFPIIGIDEPKNEVELERAIAVWLDSETSDHNMIAHRRPQSNFVLDLDGKIAVDEILRFENLQHDFERLCDRINCEPINLPQKGKRVTNNFWSPTLNKTARQLVQSYFERDFELFGYPN